MVKALAGWVKPHHRFVLTELLCQMDSLDETITRFDEQIEQACALFEEAGRLLDTLPSVARQAAEVIVAEMGAEALLGQAPQGQPYPEDDLDPDGPGRRAYERHLSGGTVTAVAGLAWEEACDLGGGHSVLVMAYYMLGKKQPYREAGADFFDKQRPEETAKRLRMRLESHGYTVTLQKPAVTVAA